MLKKLSFSSLAHSGRAVAPNHPVDPAWRSLSPFSRANVARAVCLLAVAGAVSMQAHAGFSDEVGAENTFDSMSDQDCGDVVINGKLTLAAGAGFTRVGTFTVAPTGSVVTASGVSIEVTTGWQNGGTFDTSGTSLTASNVCGNTTTTFSGSNTFLSLSATSAGHTLVFPAGTTQTVTGSLTLTGQTLNGGDANTFLTLATGASQSISDVGVNSVDASRGQRLAPTGTNKITGTAPNWFAAPVTPVVPTSPTAVPVTGPGGLALMGGLMVLAAGFVRRRKSSNSSRRDASGAQR